MHWAHYWRNVVQRYLVVVKGWPDNIPFVNLSSVSSALPDLEMLLRKWQSHAIYWRRIEEDEYEKLLQERNEKLEQGDVVEERRRTRSDKGKKRDTNSQSKKLYKSAEIVVSEEEDETIPATASPHAANGLGTPSSPDTPHAADGTPSSSDTPSGGSSNQLTRGDNNPAATTIPFANGPSDNDLMFGAFDFSAPGGGSAVGGLEFDTDFEGFENFAFGMMDGPAMSMF